MRERKAAVACCGIGKKSVRNPFCREMAERENCIATACMILPLSISPSFLLFCKRNRSSSLFTVGNRLQCLFNMHSCIHAFTQRKAPFLILKPHLFSHIPTFFSPFLFLYFFYPHHTLFSPHLTFYLKHGRTHTNPCSTSYFLCPSALTSNQVLHHISHDD